MRIGYSFWGFLGPGVADTPDGGRSHRRVLVDGLRSRGHDIVFLQPDRDSAEAGLDLSEVYTWDVGLPEIDVLFLEWRWPIPGRNTTSCGAAGHTCDLHRQQQLLDCYTHARGTSTILWDKDRQLPPDDPLRQTGNVVVCEAALHPTPGAASLLFPVADHALDAADPAALAAASRKLPLAYVGNQYDRDTAFDAFFAPAAATHPHLVAGKWTCTDAWPHVTFIGRVPFTAVAKIYSSTLATVLLLPDRYARVGQMTQRLGEAVLAGCLPLTPATIRGAAQFTPVELHVADAAEVTATLAHLRDIAGTSEHVTLLAGCVRALDLFRLSHQLDVLDRLLAGRPVGEGRGIVTGAPPQDATGTPVACRRMDMDRIAIIGCGGSGKTHLANHLAARFDLPLTHLDGVYYDAEWNPLPQEAFAALQGDLVAGPRWLIEGNYAATLPIRLAAADTVIFLDPPAVTCLIGILQRRWRYRGGQHTKDGVYDRITWSFVRYIWGYRRSMRPRVRQLLDEHGGNVRLVTLTSRRQTARFLAQLRAETSTHT
ncbi:MAG: hypothetical protein ACRDRP_19950 [Pseudonocardiaceae bacterium]